MKVLNPKIWVISSKNEGCGFPWFKVFMEVLSCLFPARKAYRIRPYEGRAAALWRQGGGRLGHLIRFSDSLQLCCCIPHDIGEQVSWKIPIYRNLVETCLLNIMMSSVAETDKIQGSVLGIYHVMLLFLTFCTQEIRCVFPNNSETETLDIRSAKVCWFF